MKRRKGKFSVLAKFIWGEEHHSLMVKIFADLVIFRAEYNFDEDIFYYMACGEMFREVDQGEMMPEYKVVCCDGMVLFKEIISGPYVVELGLTAEREKDFDAVLTGVDTVLYQDIPPFIVSLARSFGMSVFSLMRPLPFVPSGDYYGARIAIAKHYRNLLSGGVLAPEAAMSLNNMRKISPVSDTPCKSFHAAGRVKHDFRSLNRFMNDDIFKTPDEVRKDDLPTPPSVAETMKDLDALAMFRGRHFKYYPIKSDDSDEEEQFVLVMYIWVYFLGLSLGAVLLNVAFR